MGIRSLIDLPDVGQHLQDHPLLGNYFEVNSNSTFDNVFRDANVSASDLQQWNETRTGLFTTTLVNTLGFARLPDNSSVDSTMKQVRALPILRCSFLRVVSTFLNVVSRLITIV